MHSSSWLAGGFQAALPLVHDAVSPDARDEHFCSWGDVPRSSQSSAHASTAAVSTAPAAKLQLLNLVMHCPSLHSRRMCA